MNTDYEVPIFLAHVLKANISKYTGIVYQNINPTKCLNGSLNYFFTIFYTIIVRNCTSASRFNLINDNICSLILISNLFYMQRIDSTLDDAPSPLKEVPRSFTTTEAPLEPKKSAYAFPKPPPAPVTTTTLLSYLRFDILAEGFV